MRIPETARKSEVLNAIFAGVLLKTAYQLQQAEVVVPAGDLYFVRVKTEKGICVEKLAL